MILGLSDSTFTTIHVVLSLIGIASGILVLLGWLGAKRSEGLTALFLATTLLTSVTALMFPGSIDPGKVIAILSLAVLALALVALYVNHLAGAWRWIYLVAALLALYFNVFVAVVQSFQKIAPLAVLAPTQSEPPFVVAQVAVMAIFIALGVLAVRRFHPAPIT